MSNRHPEPPRGSIKARSAARRSLTPFRRVTRLEEASRCGVDLPLAPGGERRCRGHVPLNALRLSSLSRGLTKGAEGRYSHEMSKQALGNVLAGVAFLIVPTLTSRVILRASALSCWCLPLSF